ERLAKDHPCVGEIRGVGAFFGIELVKDRKTREPVVPWQSAGSGPMTAFNAALRKHGAWALSRWNFVAIAPPLVIEDHELARGFAALDAALVELEKLL
ncbi:MAG: aminotransferase class III-fold pyridoxal phosphate-dependent enzyme, partial [Candidatus Eremiobacteraeota bacterium]|nr:aminotransferase class III-fold pyridoxal phosphate-dependent enzyme [Candidatus Eremiobacteraeota bacterium]